MTSATPHEGAAEPAAEAPQPATTGMDGRPVCDEPTPAQLAADLEHFDAVQQELSRRLGSVAD
ncbi:MAG: hypothetical protein CSB46_06740 [Micrococcales bacterium]|nr:MAG: hypothetical protein CSB46_06740 [Micrococcales bacterium]